MQVWEVLEKGNFLAWSMRRKKTIKNIKENVRGGVKRPYISIIAVSKGDYGENESEAIF